MSLPFLPLNPSSLSFLDFYYCFASSTKFYNHDVLQISFATFPLVLKIRMANTTANTASNRVTGSLKTVYE